MAAWSTGKHRSQAGVTLVELLVVMIIMGIVSTRLRVRCADQRCAGDGS
jgi:prepilin-type N-terminal cleavage/methylation domain-containing protein